MKKHTLVPFLLFVFVSINIYGQTSNWTPKDRKDFITSCIGTAKANMSVDSARHYCICMQENVEARYPLTGDAAKVTAEDFSSPSWQKMIRDCLTGQWGTRDRQDFIKSCVDEARDALGEGKAKKYCECMLYQVEKLYPDINDVGELTAEVLASETWKKKALACLENAED